MSLEPPCNSMLVIGLTGGIGTGKSEVSLILRELGATVIEADLVGHDAYKPNTPIWREVVDAFGQDILRPTGEIDRKRLGAMVFSDSKALERLNGIMHPRMAEIIKDKINQLGVQGTEVVVVEAALMIEAGWDSLVDEVWVTSSPEDKVIERLRQRNHLSDEEISSRIDSQMSFEERVRHTHVILENSGSKEELCERVASLWNSRVKGKVG